MSEAGATGRGPACSPSCSPVNPSTRAGLRLLSHPWPPRDRSQRADPSSPAGPSPPCTPSPLLLLLLPSSLPVGCGTPPGRYPCPFSVPEGCPFRPRPVSASSRPGLLFLLRAEDPASLSVPHCPASGGTKRLHAHSGPAKLGEWTPHGQGTRLPPQCAALRGRPLPLGGSLESHVACPGGTGGEPLSVQGLPDGCSHRVAGGVPAMGTEG